MKHTIGLAALLGLLAALLTAGVLAQPWWTRIDVGEIWDVPYMRGFHAREYSSAQEISFRWSQPEAHLWLPGAGHLAPLEMRVHGDYAGMPLHLSAGNMELQTNLRPGWQRIALLPPPDPWSGDIALTIRTPAQVSADDPRQRGVVIDWLRLAGRGEHPPPGQAVLLGISTALLTLLAGRAFGRAWAGGVAGAALAIGSAAVLAIDWGDGGMARLLLTCYTGRLVLVLLAGGLLLAFERLLALLAARDIFPLDTPAQHSLAAIALLAFLLRFGGMAYPLNHNSDLPYILGRTWMVREGQLLTLFFPNPTLTPVQWEYDITIPRSPFYYIITTPVTYLPGYHGDRLGMMAFSSAVDACAVLLVALLTLYAGGSRRAALLAALLAGVLPHGLIFIVSWGIFPTLLAHCLSLLAVATWLHLRPRLHERRALLLLTASLTLAFLSYPTALAFLGTTGCILFLLLLLRRDAAALPTLLAGVLALGAVALLYYGWHIPEIVTNTLPTMLGDLATDIQGAGSDDDPTFTLARSLDALWLPLYTKFGSLVIGLAAAGVLLLLVDRSNRSARAADTRLVLTAWGLAYIPFALADEYVVTLILKHVLHILPVLAILGGLFLGRVSRSRRGLLVAGVVLALICWQGVRTEIYEIVYGFAHLK